MEWIVRGNTTTGKFSVGAKSPLTQGVKESDVGGEAGSKLAALGIKSLVLEDLPDQPSTSVLKVAVDRIELIDMPELKGRWVSDAIQFLRERFGRQARIIFSGPAGEMGMGAAGVAVSGPQDIQVRYAARGGLGAVMGSKGIKAIVIDDTDAPPVSVFDEGLLREAGKALVQEIMADPKAEHRRKDGTPAVFMMCNEL